METNNVFAHAGVVPSAPPPPAEVKVRTMKTDLAEMAKNGGGLPGFENVQIIPSSISSAASGGMKNSAGDARKKLIVALIAIAVVIVIALVVFAVFFRK